MFNVLTLDVYLNISEIAFWVVTGERQATRIKCLYLKTILRQDIGFFDTQSATGEFIERMSGESILVQEAMGDKVSSNSLVTIILVVFTKSQPSLITPCALFYMTLSLFCGVKSFNHIFRAFSKYIQI